MKKSFMALAPGAVLTTLYCHCNLQMSTIR
jgi:hypothetical protein